MYNNLIGIKIVGCYKMFQQLLYNFRNSNKDYKIKARDHYVIAKLVFIFFIYTFDEVVITFSHISSCVVFFVLFIYMFLIYVCNLYFCFILRCIDKFCLKCFRNTGCQNLTCHELSSCKIFQEFVLGQILLYSMSMSCVKCFMTSLIFNLFVVLLSRITKGEDC